MKKVHIVHIVHIAHIDIAYDVIICIYLKFIIKTCYVFNFLVFVLKIDRFSDNSFLKIFSEK